MPKNRKIPRRKCIVTGEMKEKKELIRVVRNKEGQVKLDPSGKQPGRGAYLSFDSSIVEKAKEGNSLAKVLKTSVDKAIYDELLLLINKNKDN